MPLQPSGEISMGNIRSELGSMASNFSLEGAEAGVYGSINQNSASRPNGLTPNSMSEWYGYDHNASPQNNCTCYTLFGSGRSGGTFGYEDCVTGEPSFAYDAGFGIGTDICARTGTVYVASGGGNFEISLNDCCSGGGGGGLTPIYLAYSAFDTCPNREDIYFINAQTFTEASEIYSDEFGTVAPDGYYGDPSCCYRSWFDRFLDSPYFC
jgi:hypothetical protein